MKLGQVHGSHKPKMGKAPKLGKGKKGGVKAPISPLAPLDKKHFNQEIRHTVNAQVRPLAQQIRSEKQGSLVRQNQEIPGWFADYQQKLAQGQAATQGAYNQAGAQWGSYLNQANATDQTARDAVNQGAQQDAALRGANVSTLAADQAANASARRTDLGALGGGTIANQGASQFSYLQNRQAIGAREQVDAQLSEGKRRQKIDQDLRDLMVKKGDLKYQSRQDLRKSERGYKIQRMAFSKPTANQRLSSRTSAAGSRRTAASSAASTAATIRGQDISASTSRGNAALSAKQSNKNSIRSSKNSGASGGRSPAEKHSDKQAFHNAYATLSQAYHSAAKKPKTPAEWHQFAAGLVAGVSDKNGNTIVAPIGGSNPHLWADKAAKKLQQQLAGHHTKSAVKGLPGSAKGLPGLK